VTQPDIQQIVWTALGLSIYLTFGHSMRPQVITWDGVSAWSISDYTELVEGNQKRTPFYRISPQGIQIQPSATSGSVTVTASAPVFSAARVGTRIRFVDRQLLITAFTDSQHVTATVQEILPGGQILTFGTAPNTVFNIGDEVIGSVTGAKGLVTSFPSGSMAVQLLNNSGGNAGGVLAVIGFTTSDIVAGPGGNLTPSAVSSASPQACSVWDDEVMNSLQGYPASCFIDQFRLGFCDFPAIPGAIGWSAINTPTDLYVGALPSSAMLEIAPSKVQIYYVVPGPEGSEFVFADRSVFLYPDFRNQSAQAWQRRVQAIIRRWCRAGAAAALAGSDPVCQRRPEYHDGNHRDRRLSASVSTPRT